MSRLSTFARAALTFASIWALPNKSFAEEPPPPSPSISRWFIHTEAGPAFATFLPIDAGGITEHHATGGSQVAIGIGYGFEHGPIRLDAGCRVQHLRIQVEGSYSLAEVDDLYHSTYDYLAFLFEGGIASRRPERVNGFATLALGTARHFSDRKGEPLRNRQLPLYGSVEAGLLIRLTAGMDARLGLSWVPPVQDVNVFAPEVGLRVQL